MNDQQKQAIFALIGYMKRQGLADIAEAFSHGFLNEDGTLMSIACQVDNLIE